jgi:hypothetical protein
VLGERIGAQHAIGTLALRHIDRALEDFCGPHQHRRALDHAFGFVENDRGLVTVRGAAVDFSRWLIVGE